jgi:hypothetical protein
LAQEKPALAYIWPTAELLLRKSYNGFSADLNGEIKDEVTEKVYQLS